MKGNSPWVALHAWVAPQEAEMGSRVGGVKGRRRALAGSALVAGLLAALASSGQGAEELNLKVSPRVSYAPSLMRVDVAIAPNQDNRRLFVEAESDSYYRSSEFTLDGEEESRIHSIEWRQLPAGSYRVMARLLGTQGTRAEVEQTVRVYELGEMAVP